MKESLRSRLSTCSQSHLPEGNFDRLLEIANLIYADLDGKKRLILTAEEVQMLSIRKDSLAEECEFDRAFSRSSSRPGYPTAGKSGPPTEFHSPSITNCSKLTDSHERVLYF
jgi:hypothetical protein